MDTATLSTTDQGAMMRTFTISWEVDGSSGSSNVEARDPISALYHFYMWFDGYRLQDIWEGRKRLGPICWMGGPKPAKWLETRRNAAVNGMLETLLASDLFRGQCEIYKEHWGDLPLGVARTFWTRARYDAHATIQVLRKDTGLPK